MTYKTVLVHLNDERRAARLAGFAAQFAEAHGAHLIGIFIVPLPVVLSEWPDIAIAELIEAQRKSYRDEAKRVAAIFSDRTSGMSRPSEWRVIESQYPTVAECLVESARMADLLIAAQADPAWQYMQTFDAPETAIMEGGRPVLIVPNEGKPEAVAKHVTVAWNGKRESTRAAFDALPAIEKAGAATIVWVDPRTGSSSVGDLPCAELATTFARHGVRIEGANLPADDKDVASALAEHVARTQSGLLVMGAYGHSRLREFVMGGTTRNVMRSMKVPVLFSH